MTSTAKPVVLGVSGDGYDAALEFAAGEVRGRGGRLHLVHVLELQSDTFAEGYFPGVQVAAEAQASVILAGAEKAARAAVDDDVTVTSELRDNGRLVAGLVAAAEAGQMIVLQHRHFGRIHRLVTRPVVNGVASRASVPVVSVPESWKPRETTAGTVTVAVQDTVESGALVRAACEIAHSRGSEVKVLHTWWLGGGYDALIEAEQIHERNARAHRELSRTLEPVSRELAGVPVSVEVLHEPPAGAIVAASRTADVLLLGRRHHLLPLGTHLGPVARTVLDHSECPVRMEPRSAVHSDG